jgi:hypothetical protein
MSVRRAQWEIASSEFVEWIAYLQMEKDIFEKIDFYGAQIAATLSNIYQMIASIFSKEKRRLKTIKIEDCLLSTNVKEVKPKKKMTKKERLVAAKSFWAGLLAGSKMKDKSNGS